jgi:hypothetical protein
VLKRSARSPYALCDKVATCHWLKADIRINMTMYRHLAMEADMWKAWLMLVTMGVEMVLTPLVVLWFAMMTTDDLFQFVIAEFLCHKILIH